mmetsp:Transcript_3185/g.9106  ORF Transcript_3185/g.9106 Transcript_3185/m.9106 type:complete len:95 (+) Transcript_3185:2139-2423(+)
MHTLASPLASLVDDLNKLEAAFVKALDYNLALSQAEYARYYFALRSMMQMSKAKFPLRELDEALAEKIERANQRIQRTGMVDASTERGSLRRSI